MLSRIRSALPAVSREKKDLGLVFGGMGALMVGARGPGLALFGKGILGIERRWRERHPEFQGGLRERWGHAIRFYEATHKDDTNRKLHMIGIPMIVGGAAGLLAFRPLGATAPLWAASAGSFGVGWALNFVGHGVYEKNRPAFADDPLSFIAGPVWDAQQWAKGWSNKADKAGTGKFTTATA